MQIYGRAKAQNQHEEVQDRGTEEKAKCAELPLVHKCICLYLWLSEKTWQGQAAGSSMLWPRRKSSITRREEGALEQRERLMLGSCRLG